MSIAEPHFLSPADDTCVAIASAGDNVLAMLSRCPGRRVIALDLNLAPLACLELRVAAFRTLVHSDLLELIVFASE